MAAMTTIIIFLPPAIHYSSPPFWVSTAEKNSCITQRDPQKLWQNCTMKVLPFLIVCFTTVALADDFKLVSGKEYKNVTVSRVDADGIVLKSKSGISKVYFVELSPDVQKRFQYNAAIASAYSAQQAVNRATMAVGRRGQPIEVISHGTQVDINQHLAFGNVTVVDFMRTGAARAGGSHRAWSKWPAAIPRSRFAKSTSLIGELPSCSGSTFTQFRR
jgi:hypothetical protein